LSSIGHNTTKPQTVQFLAKLGITNKQHHSLLHEGSAMNYSKDRTRLTIHYFSYKSALEKSDKNSRFLRTVQNSGLHLLVKNYHKVKTESVQKV